ncbi:hypothetical protein [Streptomyces sp. G-G2]|uniref:hypothetical protein n=1 Tax=Streptomyces sp. G-G2 TaxID=3046201 RepID=UPI0024B9B866|nr:hypothetical protein [Streptomyces sp. G-G2]MDJ0385340.1 hypothetical protein [Streptomyces sp. G-G2]
MEIHRADNVDRAAHPTGSAHVFCYYYAVRQPSRPGTIVVRKHVLGTTGAQPFTFDGHLSYNPGGLFQSAAGPGSDGEQTSSSARRPPRPGRRGPCRSRCLTDGP